LMMSTGWSIGSAAVRASRVACRDGDGDGVGVGVVSVGGFTHRWWPSEHPDRRGRLKLAQENSVFLHHVQMMGGTFIVKVLVTGINRASWLAPCSAPR
jgi:hypothetical protein